MSSADITAASKDHLISLQYILLLYNNFFSLSQSHTHMGILAHTNIQTIAALDHSST